MSTELATIEFTADQVDLVKRTICWGATNDELTLFVQQCKRTGLDPFSRQIHAVKRWDAQQQREVMSIQTGIDGFRLIAERTGKYAGNDDPVYDVENAPHPNKATVTVWKMVGGQRVPFSRSARWAEFVQTKKGGEVTKFWAKMPYLMLGKVAEALALRAAFPQELSGLYTSDEMPATAEHDENEPPQPPQRTDPKQIPGVKSGADLKPPRDVPAEFAACTSLAQLGSVWTGLSQAEQRTHLAAKDKRKAELSEGEQSRPPSASSATAADASATATSDLPKRPRTLTTHYITDLIFAVAEKLGVSEVTLIEDVCAAISVESIDGITTDKMQAADAWLREQAVPA